MKNYKTVNGFINHLNDISNHEVKDLRGVDDYTDEQIAAITEIQAFINNQIGEYLCDFFY